ncbi:hypothetical protein AGMMS50239_38840 [Bacteroidia bacterium]|nr:hypothetical protein AGMMS50239_38840 [Bacteroidia bacterium]
MLISCSDHHKNALDYMQNVKQIKGEWLPVNCIIGNPYSMTTMDSLLIFYDRHEGKTITVFNLNRTQCVGRFVSEGNGPGEVIAPVDVMSFSQKDELYTFQRNTGAISTFSVPEMKMKSTVFLQNQADNLQKMQDFFVGLGFYTKGRFGIYDMQGNLLRTEGQYPFRGETMDLIPAFITYQGYHCASPHGNYFAIGSLFCDHLAFYEVREDETILLKQYESRDVKAKYQDQLLIENQCTVNYTWAYGTDAHCYLLYSGKTYEGNNQRTDGGNYLIVFDWEGNYEKTLKTDREIRTFCVDEQNSRIYAVALNDIGEYGIMRFSSNDSKNVLASPDQSNDIYQFDEIEIDGRVLPKEE